MRQNSLLLTVLAALYMALLAQASPTSWRTSPPSRSPARHPSRSPSRPPSPVRPPSKPVIKHSTRPPKSKPVAHPAPAHDTGPSSSSSSSHQTSTTQTRTELLTEKAKCGIKERNSCQACAAASKVQKVKLRSGEGRKATTVNVRCAWQQATSDPQGKCIGIDVATSSDELSTLHITTEQGRCKELNKAVSGHQEEVLRTKQEARATQIWNAMASHVLGTREEKNAVSGTHVATKWLEKHPTDKLQVDKDTMLADSTTTPAKTLWLDNDPGGRNLGPYTAHDVETMCKDALIALMQALHRDGDGRQSPAGSLSGHSNAGSEHSNAGSVTHSATDDTIRIPVEKRAFSVKSPRTHNNVCITIAPQKADDHYSCYPSNRKVTPTAAGKECTQFRGGK